MTAKTVRRAIRLGASLRKARLVHGITQRMVGNDAGLSPNSVSRLLNLYDYSNEKAVEMLDKLEQSLEKLEEQNASA